MTSIRRAAERYRTGDDGVRSWHCFSAGPHYDPANTSFGPVIACDEHLLQPGAGFAEHAHRAVIIVSRVLSGVLRHVDAGGASLDVGPGALLVQVAGEGIRHTETNGGDTPLRFVQTMLLDDRPGPARVELVAGPVLALPGARFAMITGGPVVLDARAHVLVTAGRWQLGAGEPGAGEPGAGEPGAGELGPGDSARLGAGASLNGAGELLAVVPVDRRPAGAGWTVTQ